METGDRRRGCFFFLLYAMSGLTQVAADEVAIVRQFGRPIEEDLGPGLHWRWPWPIDTIVRVQPERIRTVEIGFRSTPGTGPTPAAQTWSSIHGDGVRRISDEAVMITGDGNLVELQATVRYTATNPRVCPL